VAAQSSRLSCCALARSPARRGPPLRSPSRHEIWTSAVLNRPRLDQFSPRRGTLLPEIARAGLTKRDRRSVYPWVEGPQSVP
jgi:hypothetical protein